MGNLDEQLNADNAQLKALMQVINEITDKKVSFYEPHELAARSTLRALQWQIDDRNVLDDGELIDVLNQARIEVKYLCSIITDLKKAWRRVIVTLKRCKKQTTIKTQKYNV
jgi:hypothetical protein